MIVPCYNYAHYLPGCLESILGQTDVQMDVLVIDDCSSDETTEVATRIAERDPRVKVRRHDRNMGHLRTYNEGFEWSSGDYTALVSADDLLTPGALGRAVAVLDSHPGVGFAYGRSVYFETDAELPALRTGPLVADVWPGRDWMAKRCRTATNCISSPEVVMRTSLLHQLGGFKLDLPHTGDLELWLRLAAHADVAYLRGTDQAYYRVHQSSMYRTQFASPISDLRQRAAAFDRVLSDHGACVGASRPLTEQAHRALAREALWSACRSFDRGRYDAGSVEELTAFALSVDTRARSLPEYRGLRRRQMMGPRWCPYVQPLVWRAVTHKLRNWWWWRRWNWYGV